MYSSLFQALGLWGRAKGELRERGELRRESGKTLSRPKLLAFFSLRSSRRFPLPRLTSEIIYVLLLVHVGFAASKLHVSSQMKYFTSRSSVKEPATGPERVRNLA